VHHPLCLYIPRMVLAVFHLLHRALLRVLYIYMYVCIYMGCVQIICFFIVIQFSTWFHIYVGQFKGVRTGGWMFVTDFVEGVSGLENGFHMY